MNVPGKGIRRSATPEIFIVDEKRICRAIN
jgi:hypothetical protein